LADWYTVLQSIKKITLVIFITLLIWVWADRALDEELSGVAASLSADPSAGPKLWISFNNESSAHFRMTLSGPVSRITEVKRKLKDRLLKFEFFLDPEKEKIEVPIDGYPLDLLGLIEKNVEVKKLGLKIESCEPSNVSVTVLKLVEKSLPIECLDEDRLPIVDVESIDPPRVKMPVPENWMGDQLKATVRLTSKQIEQARLSAISDRPYIEITPGNFKYSEQRVQIKLSARRERLQDYGIPATIGFTLSENLFGKYKVELTDRGPSTIGIKATPEAKTAYENTSFKLLLFVEDEDTKATEPILRELVYNFPAQFVQKDEIRATQQQPPKVRFKLIPLPSAETSPSIVQ
jgi:hypothetical protein